MKISRAILCQEAVRDQQHRVCSKKFVQQGRSPFRARSVLARREHGKSARTPLADFFNRPTFENWMTEIKWAASD